MAEIPMGTQPTDPISSTVATPTTGLISPPVRSDHDDEAERLRGVVALPHQRSILFTDEVELDVGILPRWRPQITVDERRIADDDHECPLV